MSHWTLFSNHGHVLLFVARHPEARLRDIAERVGITERAVQKIVRDLQDGGLLSVSKHGRCNRYAIDGALPLRHELEAHCRVGQLVGLVHPLAEGMGDMPGEAAPLPVAAPRPEPEPPPPPPARRAPEPVAKPAPKPQSKPQPDPRPKPQPESRPKPQPEPKPAHRPAPAKPATRKPRKPEPKGGGEQGSLF